MIFCEKCGKLLSWNSGTFEEGKWIVRCPECKHGNTFSGESWEAE